MKTVNSIIAVQLWRDCMNDKTPYVYSAERKFSASQVPHLKAAKSAMDHDGKLSAPVSMPMDGGDGSARMLGWVLIYFGAAVFIAIAVACIF